MGHDRSQMVDFSLFPNEVAEHILCWLDSADLGVALLVCRQWAALITALPAWAEARAAHDRKQRWGLRVPSRRLATQVEEYRIAVTGPGGVGRCAFTERFITDVMPTQYNPVIEDDYRKQLTVDDVTALVEINVSAGQEEYLALVEQILRTREGFVVMYSVTDRSSFERANDYLKLIHRIFDATPATAPPIIVLANKLDLIASGSTWDTRVVTPEEGKRLADKWTAYSWGLGEDSQAAEYHFRHNFFECSIKEAYLVEYALTGAQLPASASAATGETVLPPEAAPHGEWEVHHGIGLVVDELVRQIDMWRRAVGEGSAVHAQGKKEERRRKKRGDKDKKCLLM